VKKILYVITSLDYGGTQKNLFLILSALNRARYQPVVVALKEGGYYSELIRQKNIPVYNLGLPSETNLNYYLLLLKAFTDLKELIEQEKPDLIHSFLFQANILARLAARPFGITVICSERVQELQKSYQYLINRRTSSLVKIFTVNSRELRDFLLWKLKLPEEKIILIPNIVEIPHQEDSEMKKNWQWLRDKYLLEENIPVILSVGRLHYQKGFDLLLRALAQVRFPYYCFIVGDGPEKENLHKLADVLELKRKVFFTGWVSPTEISRYYQGADLFVLASRWEGMPNVLLEARANNLAIITTAVSGVAEIVTDEEDGTIVPVNNEEKLTAAIEYLLSDDSRREQFRHSGRQKLSNFSVTNVLRQLEELYERISS